MKYYIFIIVFYFFLTKIIVNTDTDVSGSFQSSNAAYVVAFLTLLFIWFIVVRNYRKLLKLPTDWYFILPLIYYMNALIFSYISLIPQISFFRAISGIGFVFVALSIGKYLSRFEFKIQIEYFYKIILYLFAGGTISNIFYHYIYKSNFSITDFQAGFMALLSIYLSLWHFINYKYTLLKKEFLLFLFFFAITFLLHSFSAFISFYFALVYILIFTNQKYLGSFLIILPVTSISYVVSFLNSNPDMWILGKPAGAYLIGSGRFVIHEASFDLYYSKLDFLQQIIGIGFMAERNLLSTYELTWSTDPHNSFIVSLLGMGIMGAILYICFIIFPFLKKKFLLTTLDKNTYLKWIVLHIVFSVYGITSSSYLGVPTFQLIFFILFSYLIFKNRKNHAKSTQ